MTDPSVERRPNPPGWTQPRAPYNPYDINDVRPPQGYPSEFKPPGRESSFSEIPRDASEYQALRYQMKKLQYTPRPNSELYPGKYKILRRIHTKAKFEQGVRMTSGVLTFGIVTYCVFFYRWNDGFENIFSGFYRKQLELRHSLFGNLSEEQTDDLHNVKQVKYGKYIPESKVPENVQFFESEHALQRPTKRHLLEAERIMQERELDAMKSQEVVAPKESMDTTGKRRKWLGLF